MSQQFFPPKEGAARPQMNTTDAGGGRKPHGWIGEKGTDTVRPPDGAKAEDAYVVTTPNPNFNGITAHVAFTGGRALVYDQEIARRLRDDFHYAVTPELPPVTPQPDAPVRKDMNLVSEPRVGTSGQTALDAGTVLDRPKAFVDLGLDGPSDDAPRDARDLGLG
jgi:hypothetical protein